MPKKFFIFIILLLFIVLSLFSYYFYNTHSLKSRNPNKTFNPKSFSEKILDQTIILAPNSLMYRFLKNTCSSTKNGTRNENINLKFNNVLYSKVDFRYHTTVLGTSANLIDEYYVVESLQDSNDSILYKQHFSFDPEDEFSSIEVVKKDNTFILNRKKTSSIKETCEYFNREYSENLSKITNLNVTERKEIIKLGRESFNTSYVKYGVDVNVLREADKIKFFKENWTATEKELNGFSIKSMDHRSDHTITTQIIYYKFDRKN